MTAFSIAQNEIKRHFRDKLITLVSVIMLSLLIASVVTGVNYQQELAKQHTDAEKIARHQWVHQGDKNPHSAAHYGLYVFKPVRMLAIYEPGVDRYTGVSLFLEGHRQNVATFGQAADKDTVMRFAELTPAFIFAYLFPLFIILVGYRSITSEKETGTYRFMLSQGVRKSQIIAGKVLGLWGIVLLLYIPFIIVGIGILIFTNPESSDITRFAVLGVIWLLYFGIITHITVGVSSLSNKSGTAMVVLLSLWILSTLLIPRLITNVSSQIYPVPSTTALYQAIQTDLTEGLDGHNPLSEHSIAFRDSVLRAHGVDDIAKLPFNFRGMMLQEAEEFEKRVYDHHLSAISDIHQKQATIFLVSSVLSPTIATRLSSMTAAGTDVHAYNHFTDYAEDYRVRLMKDLNMDLMNNAIGDGAAGYSVGADFFSQNIEYSYEQPPNILYATGQSIAIVIVICWFVISALFIWLVGIRKEVA